MNIIGKKRESAYLNKRDEWVAKYEAGESFTSIAKSAGVYYRTVQSVLQGYVKPRPKKTYAHLMDKWVEAYEVKEMNANEIAQAYKVDAVTVAKYLREAGVEIRGSRHKPSSFESVIPEWVERYKKGETLKQIADDYGTYPQTVHKHIEKKIEMRHYAETSQIHEMRQPDYFEAITTHEKAYWLGVWFGTGFIASTPFSRECSLVIKAEERQTVDRFREVVGYSKPVSVIHTGASEVIRLRIHNKQFVESLEQNGLIPDKSDILAFPEHLPDELYPSFILGYYEGKGSCKHYIHTVKGNQYGQIMLYFYGSQDFLESLQRILQEKIGVEVKIVRFIKKTADDGYRYEIQISQLQSLKKIIQWLYGNTPVYSEVRDMRPVLKERLKYVKEKKTRL